MAQKKNVKTKKENTNKKASSKKANENTKKSSHIYEIIAIASIAISLWLVLSLYFNNGGPLGEKVVHFLKGMLGASVYFLPPTALFIFIHSIVKKNYTQYKSKYIMCAIMYLMFAGLIHVLSGVEGWEYRLEGKTLLDYWKKYYNYYSYKYNSLF